MDLIERLEAGEPATDEEVLAATEKLLKDFLIFVELAVDTWGACPYPEQFKRKAKEARAIVLRTKVPA